MFNYVCIYIYISMQIYHIQAFTCLFEAFMAKKLGDGSERPRGPQSWLRRFLVSKYWGTLWFLRFQKMNWKDPPFSSWVNPLFLW